MMILFSCGNIYIKVRTSNKLKFTLSLLICFSYLLISFKVINLFFNHILDLRSYKCGLINVVVDSPFASIKYFNEVRQLNFPSEPRILQGRLRFK